MKKYVSGIRPSGKLHLGNYLGVIKRWKEIYKAREDCYFFVADMHGQYSDYEVATTRLDLGQLGVHTEAQSLYRSELLSLAHELSFHAKTSRLKNMTQYKDKSESETSTLALFAYPVLMAADVLFHKATHIPVGHDQLQHLELARELARATNRLEPEAEVRPYGAKIMSLTDPEKKMSKSDADQGGCIYISDDADTIKAKLKGAASSPAGIMNLTNICRALGDDKVLASEDNYLKFKMHVADLIIAEFRK